MCGGKCDLCADRFNPLLFQPHLQLLKGLKNVEGARKGKVTTSNKVPTQSDCTVENNTAEEVCLLENIFCSSLF